MGNDQEGFRPFAPDPDVGMVRRGDWVPAHGADGDVVGARLERFPGWVTSLRFNDRGELVGVTFEREVGVDSSRDITRNAINDYPLGKVESEARRWLRWARAEYAKVRPPNVVAAEREARRWDGPAANLSSFARKSEAFDSYEQSPAKKRDDRWYARLAADYVEACQDGPRAIQRLAAARDMAPATIRNAVRDARSNNRFLTATPNGKQGGELTEYARDILRAKD